MSVQQRGTLYSTRSGLVFPSPLWICSCVCLCDILVKFGQILCPKPCLSTSVLCIQICSSFVPPQDLQLLLNYQIYHTANAKTRFRETLGGWTPLYTYCSYCFCISLWARQITTPFLNPFWKNMNSLRVQKWHKNCAAIHKNVYRIIDTTWQWRSAPRFPSCLSTQTFFFCCGFKRNF